MNKLLQSRSSVLLTVFLVAITVHAMALFSSGLWQGNEEWIATHLQAPDAWLSRWGASLFGPSEWAFRVPGIALSVCSTLALTAAWLILANTTEQRREGLYVGLLYTLLPTVFLSARTLGVEAAFASFQTLLFAGAIASLRLSTQAFRWCAWTLLSLLWGLWLRHNGMQWRVEQPIANTLESIAHRLFPWTGFAALGSLRLLSSARHTTARRLTFVVLVLSATASVFAQRHVGLIAFGWAPIAVALATLFRDLDETATRPVTTLWIVLFVTGVVLRDIVLYPTEGASLVAVARGESSVGAASLSALLPWTRVSDPMVRSLSRAWLLEGALVLGALAWSLRVRRAWVLVVAAMACAVVRTSWAQRVYDTAWSSRDVWHRVQDERASTEEIAWVGARASLSYYASSDTRVLTTIEAGLEWLSDDQTARWLLIPSRDLVAMNALYRARKHRNVHVRFPVKGPWVVLHSHKGEFNPLERVVLQSPVETHPKAVLGNAVEWASCSFSSGENGIVRAGESIDAECVFDVRARVEGSYQVFVHVDGPSSRIVVDHDPPYPTQDWQPGDRVVDHFTIEIPRFQQSGLYTVYLGLFQVDRRMHVTRGSHDGSDRLTVGTFRVR